MSLTLNKLYAGFSFTKFRSLFYMVSPNETYTEYHKSYHYQSLLEDATFWFTLLVIMEGFYHMFKGIHTERCPWPDTLTSCSVGLIHNTMRVLLRSTEYDVYLWVYNTYGYPYLAYNSWGTWILSFLFIDFAYYWFHRVGHRVTFFWSLHQLHHSSNYYNISAVHHGRNPYCIDKNFGGVLIIWDRMFGTFAQERKEEYPVFGLVTPVETYDQIYIHLFHLWNAVWVKPSSMIGWKNKIQSVFGQPEWHPDGNIKIPIIEYPIKKYNIEMIPWWLICYSLLHFMLFNMEVYVYFYEYEQSLEWRVKLWYTGYIIGSTVILGYLLDMRWFGRHLELLRLSYTYFWNPLAPVLAIQNAYFLVLYDFAFISSMAVWAFLSDWCLGLQIRVETKARNRN